MAWHVLRVLHLLRCHKTKRRTYGRNSPYFNPYKPNEFSISSNWMSSFTTLGILGGIFHFHSKFDRILCKQTLETLIRHRILWRLIWVCTVCLCPTKRTLGLYGLNTQKLHLKELLVSDFVCKLIWLIKLKEHPETVGRSIGPWV